MSLSGGDRQRPTRRHFERRRREENDGIIGQIGVALIITIPLDLPLTGIGISCGKARCRIYKAIIGLRGKLFGIIDLASIQVAGVDLQLGTKIAEIRIGIHCSSDNNSAFSGYRATIQL